MISRAVRFPALFLAVVVVAAGCAGVSTAGRASDAPRHATPAVVGVAHGCPASLRTSADVTNRFPGQASRLLPPGMSPTGGLVCDFAGLTGTGPTIHLRRTVPLDHAAARRLATVIDAISLKTPQGEFACPADFGSEAIIALRYRSDLTVDLRYTTSGCRKLDNGRTRAFQATNPSFADRFESVYDSIVPPPP